MTKHLEVVPEFQDTFERPAWWFKEQWLASRPASSQPRMRVEGKFREWALAREGIVSAPAPSPAVPQSPTPKPSVPPPYRPKHQAGGTFTYMIGADGSDLVKIGWAKEPEKRVAYLQIGSPTLLTLLWSDEGPYEGPLHRRFKDYRVRGEWFDLTSLGDPVEVVKAAVEEIKAASEDQP